MQILECRLTMHHLFGLPVALVTILEYCNKLDKPFNANAPQTCSSLEETKTCAPEYPQGAEYCQNTSSSLSGLYPYNENLNTNSNRTNFYGQPYRLSEQLITAIKRLNCVYPWCLSMSTGIYCHMLF